MDTLFAVILLFATVSNAAASDWSYTGDDGPDHWADNYTTCGGESQSPINIDTSTVDNDNLGTFTMVGYDNINDKTMTVVNNGHSLQVNLEGDYSVSGGGLQGSYLTSQFHFHWGSNLDQGSEHVLNNNPFPVEMHIVHYSERFDSLTAALSDPTGVAVLGFFIEMSEEDNPNFNTLLNATMDVQQAEEEFEFPSAFTLSSLLPDDLSEFYRYNGSLTTPACNEAVVWTMFKQRIYLSSSQIALYRTLQKDDGDTLQDNFRPIQSLNGRTVVFSSPDYPSHGSFLVPSLLFSILSFVILAFMK